MRSLALAPSRRRSALSGFSLLLLASCSTYDESLLVDGTGGTAGAGGASGAAGSSGASGVSGTSGTAGANAGTGGASGSSGSSGSSATGGTAGVGEHCSTPTDCPGSESLCSTRTCVNNVCGLNLADDTTKDPTEEAGNCKKRACDGQGNLVDGNDDLDLPDDTNPCTNDICTDGVASHTNVDEGISCGGVLICDGAGNCTGCVTAMDCPGEDTECATRTCESGGVCSHMYAAAGTVLTTQTLGDCQTAVCGEEGVITSNAAALDIPADDGNSCTSEACNGAVPAHPPVASGQICASMGGTHCDGAGVCAPTCTDGVKNGNETAMDCGGGTCGKCGDGLACSAPSDCQSNQCENSFCKPLPPTVTSTVPVDGSSGTTPTTTLISFSKAMTPSTLTGQTTAGPCTGSVQVSSNEFASCVAFVIPAPVMSNGNTGATFSFVGLSSQTRYKLRVTTGAQSTANLPLTSAFTHTTGFTTAAPSSFCTGSLPVVISQVYGGGGNVGAPYKNDFIELHNRGTTPVSVAGWSVQYASTTGSTWQATPLTGSIPAGGFYLVQEAGLTVGAALPTPDVTGMINMSGTGGKVVLVTASTVLSGTCPSGGTLVDLVGYGSANCSEGAPTSATSNTTSVIRGGSGCTDTSANGSDFTVGAPTPRNSSTVSTCGCAGIANNESDTTNEMDGCSLLAPTTTSAAAGQATAMLSGQVFETGLTEAAGPNPQILAQCGYGPAGSNPTNTGTWIFSDAVYGMQSLNNDVYQTSLIAPATGSYAYTFRFSRDAGGSWTYCDTDGAGSGAGSTFTSTLLGTLTVP